MTWYATGISAGLTGLVGVLITLPTSALLLVGGAVADRFGIRRMLIAGDAAMLGLTLFVVLITARSGVHPWLLVTAFAFEGAAAVDGVTFALILLVLWRIRPPHAPAPVGAEHSGLSILRPLAAVWRTPELRSVLVVTAAVAGAVLPAVIYGPSLLARQSGWTAGASGSIEVGWLVGGIAVTAAIARRGTARRIGAAAAIGLVMIMLGLIGTALAPQPVVAFACTVVLGVGVSVCTGHLWPAYLRATPMDRLGRYQALLVFVQMTALLVATVVFTTVAGRWGARWSFGGCGVVILTTLAWWARSKTTVRSTRDP